MKSPSALPEIRPAKAFPPQDHLPRCRRLCHRAHLGLVLLAVIRTSAALAGEQGPIAGAALNSAGANLRQPPMRATAPTLDLANITLYSAPVLDSSGFPGTDFRPRKHTVFDADPAVSSFGDAPMLRSTTVWQRLTEYKSRDRVRLLTLWESSGSTVSLQAGKRGNPSLQWTSRVMNRGGSTQGLFDRLLSISLAHAGNSLRSNLRSTPGQGSGAGTNKHAGVPMITDRVLPRT